jgi:hypothetical protein
MREIRQSGSEGGGDRNQSALPTPIGNLEEAKVPEITVYSYNDQSSLDARLRGHDGLRHSLSRGEGCRIMTILMISQKSINRDGKVKSSRCKARKPAPSGIPPLAGDFLRSHQYWKDPKGGAVWEPSTLTLK